MVGEFAFELNLPVGAYFLLEGIGNLALAVPATAAGIGTFDYLTLLAAKGIDVNPDKATAYVLTMHALAVLPVTPMGAILVSPAFPRPSAGGASPRRNQADDSGSREPLALAYSRARNGKVRCPAWGHRERFGEPPAAAGSRRQVGLDRRPSSRAAATASPRSRSSACRSASAPACSRGKDDWPQVSGIVIRRSARSAPRRPPLAARRLAEGEVTRVRPRTSGS